MSTSHLKRGTLAAITVFCGFTATAFADDARGLEEVSITIDYSDLDLTQPAAAQSLYRRVTAAAKHVCGEPDLRELAQYARYKRCFDHTLTETVARLDVPQLTALHRAKTSRRMG